MLKMTCVRRSISAVEEAVEKAAKEVVVKEVLKEVVVMAGCATLGEGDEVADSH